MTISIDSNIFVAFWKTDDALNSLALSGLDEAHKRPNLVVTAPVFAELLAYPTRDEEFLGRFFRDTSISIDWDFNEAIWRIAGRAFQSYAGRRRKQVDSGPRRFLADFLIGAHAMHHGYGLLTFDDRLYRAAFPRLRTMAL
jgi:predicted nucleic acid-binding protein